MTPELWQRLKPLYHAALEIPDDARAQFVAEACGTDADLKNELTALLKEVAEQTGRDYTAPIVNLRDWFPVEVKSFAPGELILGRFRILRHLGSGGMGDVYEAMDLELGRVALKAIRADFGANPELLTRFKREVQLARKVSGPNVSRIHELFLAPSVVTGSHPAFLTMEFLDGITLADKISESGSVPWREARAIAREICAGLHTIHEAGIVHRDLKPRNIMLTARNGRTCAVLMDFGLASEVVRPTNGSHEGVTTIGAILGTPDYMAPEQFEGGVPSPSTDIYALGVVLYEMLTGKQPFAGATAIAAAVQRGRRLKPASSLQPRLPRQWDDIIGKCLEFKSEERYQSAEELQRSLELLPPDGMRLFPFRSVALLRRIRQFSPVMLWLSILLTSLLLITSAFLIFRFYPHAQPFASVSVEQMTNSGDITKLAISPDGKTLAEVRSAGGQHAIWIRNISTGRDVEVLPPVPFNYGSLFFSRDGNNIYFARSDGANSFNFYRMSVLGGEPTLIVLKIDDKVSLSPDENKLAYGVFSGGNGEVHIVTLATSDDALS